MYAICIESSHARGMGHFFRALNLLEYLDSKNEKSIVYINDNHVAISLLKQKKINFQIVNLSDFTGNWETELIKRDKIEIWINDRLDTDIRHSHNVVINNVKLITFDDHGSGAELAEINFSGLEFNSQNFLKGKKVFTGIDYLILNREINKFKRIRDRSPDKIIVTLGGSDTYGVTLKIIKILKELNKPATILIGPSFKHKEKLAELISVNYMIKNSVPSLVEEFYYYDLAITGGGITPFEANASGLPCIIIANELHEMSNGKFLENLGSSVFAGFWKNINKNFFNNELDLSFMSKKGIESIKTNAVDNIYYEIKNVK